MSQRIFKRARITPWLLLASLTWCPFGLAQSTGSGAYSINDFIVDMHPKPDSPAMRDHLAERKFYRSGIETMQKKNFGLVQKMAQSAIKEHPHWCAPYILIGRVAKDQYEDDLAMANFKKGAEVAPLCTLPLKEMAASLQRDTAYEQSIALVDKTLKMIGDNKDLEMRLTRSELYFCKASDLTALKRFDRAVACMEQYYQCTFDSNLGGSRLAEAYLKAGQYKNAVKFCSAKLKVEPVFIDYYFWRGLSYQALGQDKLAIADLCKFIQPNNSTIAVNSKDRTARTARAALYEKTGQMQLAKADRNFLQKEQIDAYNDTIFRDRRK